MKIFAFLSLIILGACVTTTKPTNVPLEIPAPVEHVVVKTVPIKTPRPVVPSVDPLKMRPVNWVIITPDNIEEQFNKVKNGDVVFFALTAEGYENISLNLSDIRAAMQQQQQIIALYDKSFEK